MMTVDDSFMAYQRSRRVRDELYSYVRTFPGTPMALRAELLLRLTAGVVDGVEVAIDTSTPMHVEARVSLPWWAWLTLGLLHLVVARRARRILRSAAPAIVATRVTMGVRRNRRPAALAGVAVGLVSQPA